MWFVRLINKASEKLGFGLTISCICDAVDWPIRCIKIQFYKANKTASKELDEGKKEA